jgi:hypothetical protein
MPKATAKPNKLPKSLGQCADLLYATRQTRLALQREVDELQAQETAIKDHLINTLPKDDSTGAAGKVARVQITVSSKATAEDWPKVYEFVRKYRRFDLLYRRLNDSAVKEMWDAGKEIPGVGKFNVVGVSCTALKGGDV